MQRMKRYPALHIFLLLVIVVLTACGGATATNTVAPIAAPSTAPSTAPSAAGSTAPTAASGGAAATARPSAVVSSPGAATALATAASPAASGGGGGGTLTGAFDVGPGGSPQGFNPMTQGAGFYWLEKYYSKMVVYDVGFTKIQGDLAESWEISPDATQFTFKLRKGVTWHDGQPFTSEDTKFSIELFKNPDSASPYAPKYLDISEMQTPDPQTLIIKTSKPNAAMLDAMTFVFMLPKHAIGTIAAKDLVKNTWWSTSPIGTGPFKWSKYVPDQYVELNPTGAGVRSSTS